jgi:hypothetical protein
MNLKSFVPFVLFIVPLLSPIKSFAFSDAPILLSIAANTANQVERLEKSLSFAKTQIEFTKKLKEATDEMRDAYDTFDDVQSNLVAIAELADKDMEGLEDINDAIESLDDKKDRLKSLIKKANEANKTSVAVEEATKESRGDLNKEIAANNKQISKSFGFSARKNQNQVTAQNTGLINNKLTVTNSLLRKQTQSYTQLNQLLIADIVNREKDLHQQESFMEIGKKKRN